MNEKSIYSTCKAYIISIRVDHEIPSETIEMFPRLTKLI